MCKMTCQYETHLYLQNLHQNKIQSEKIILRKKKLMKGHFYPVLV